MTLLRGQAGTRPLVASFATLVIAGAHPHLAR